MTKDGRKLSTPFGLPRVVITTAYFIVLAITGMAVQASDPLQELMKLSGAYNNIKNEDDRETAITSVVGFGLSFSVLSGAIVGPCIDLVGSKITALIGLMLHSFGYIFMFFMRNHLLYYVSGICFGTGFQFILNSHLSVGCLFPKNSNIVLSIISAGTDVSLFMPRTILSFAEQYGGGSSGVKTVVFQYLIIFVSIAALIDFFLLPLRPYSSPIQENDDERLLMNDTESAENSEAKCHGPIYATYSLRKQLKTQDYWIYVILFMLSFCRKKYFSLFIRPMLCEMDPDANKATANLYADVFNTIVPAGFIPGILWGALCDRYSIVLLLFISNTLGLCCSLLCTTNILLLQILTIAIYVVYQSFIFGQAMAFISSTYGFSTIANLLGIASTVVGAFSVLMDFFLAPFIKNTLGSYRMANFVWIIIGLIMYVFPLILHILRRRRQKNSPVERYKIDDTTNFFESIFPMTQCFDKESLCLLDIQAHKSHSYLVGHSI